MKFLKTFVCFALIAVVALSGALVAFAKPLDVPEDVKPLLQDYYLVYVNRLGEQRIVTSDKPFYLYFKDEKYLFSSDKYSFSGSAFNDDLKVYWGSDCHTDSQTNLFISFNFENGQYFSNFDICHYNSDDDFETVFYKTAVVSNIDVTNPLGNLRIITFRDWFLVVLIAGISIMAALISVSLIKRIVYKFGG